MHIALVDPQIPQNTGSIARTCAATKCPLHVIGTPAFELSDKKARRAGLDYWPYVDLHVHQSWSTFLEKYSSQRMWFFSKFSTRPYTEAKFNTEDILVFGNETKGLGKEFLEKLPSAQQLLIPMKNTAVRSLNLSNAVSIALYHALNQTEHWG